MKNIKWARRYIALADFVAQWSEDESTKVGAVIVDPSSNRVVSVGYNGFPRGVDQTIAERHERPTKYGFFEHAERNAIFNADQSVRGMVMYLNYAPESCEDCTRAVIQSGIKVLIGSSIPFKGKGHGTHYHVRGTSDIMFDEAGVDRFLFNEETDTIYPYRIEE